MKISRRIASLILALLMVLTALPLTLIGATAATATTENAATGTPGELPATLPNGKTFAGTPFHNYDVAAKYQENSSGWWGSFGTGVMAMLQDGAEGIIFKVDTTNAADTTSDTMAMTFAISLSFNRLSDGVKSDTYLIATPKQAAGWSANVVTTANDKSTWYYSNDGATWNSVTATGTSGSYVNVPVGKQVTYVYVPMDAFWTKEGESFLKTGTNVPTENTLNWLDAREMIEDNYRMGSVRYLFSGNTTPAKDANVTISNWQIVDHVQNVGDMALTPFMENGDYCGDTNKYKPNWTGGDYIQKDAELVFKSAKGMLVEVSNATAAPSFSVMLSSSRADGKFINAYLLSTFGQANGFGSAYVANGSGDTAKDQSSVAYWSEDGKNWTAITQGNAHSAMPKAAEKAYVYIPFESWWTRHAEKDIAQDETKSSERVDKNDWVEAIGDGWTFGYIHVYGGAGTEFHNWSLVGDESLVKSDAAPYKLPDGNYYTTKNLFSNEGFGMSSAVNNNWCGGIAATAADGINNAQGIMFKLDTTAVARTWDPYNLWFTASVTGNNGRTTYLMSNAGAVPNYGEATRPAGAVSTWYYSVDGATWIEINDANVGTISVLDGINTEAYVYVPFTSMYVKSGETFMKTGTNVKTEPGMSYLAARELAGGWKSMGSFRFFGSKALGTGWATHWHFVYNSDTAPVVPSKDNLPVIGETFTSPVFAYDKTGAGTKPGGTLASTGTDSFRNAEGIMFELDNTGATGVDPIQFTFAISANSKNNTAGSNNYFWANAYAKNYTNSTVPADAISVWYWSEDGVNWKAYTSDATTDRMTLSAKKTRGYVYIPFTSFWSRYTKDFISGKNTTSVATESSCNWADYMEAIGSDYTISYFNPSWGSAANSASCFTDNWVYVDLDKTVDVFDQIPTTLPGGATYDSQFPLFIEEHDAMNSAHSGLWQDKILTPGVTDAFAAADGIIFKMDATGRPAASSMSLFTFSINAVGKNGVSTYITSNMGQARTYLDTTPAEDATSTWYISPDGVNWTPVTQNLAAAKSTAHMQVANQRSEFFVYIPKSAMYVRAGATQLAGGAKTTTDKTLTLAEAEAITGGWTDFNNMAIWLSGDGLKVSDFYLVGKSAGIFNTASVTLTDSLAYNIYANVPAGATNVKMTFTLDGVATVVEGVAQANGTVKYAFEGILPQQMGKTITATWTATVDGKTVTETHSNSIKAYAETLIARKITYAKWIELAKAMLHYGAAAQSAAGQTGDLVNKDLAASVFTVDLGKIPTTYSNGNNSVWTSAALVLQGKITMKIGVTAPAGVSQVIYTIGEKTVVAPIADGYVYIPVGAAEMMDVITINLYNGKKATGEALAISPMYYLAQAKSGSQAALVQAIANYAFEAITVAEKRTGVTTTTATTLAQLELDDPASNGMAYIIKLQDGRFVIVDGGTGIASHANRLYNYLLDNNGYNKPVIAAWIITHADGDHADNAFKFLNDYRYRVDLENFLYSFPAESNFAAADTDSELIAEQKASALQLLKSRLSHLEANKARNPETNFVVMKGGSTYTYGEVQANVIVDGTTVLNGDSCTHNAMSAIIKFNFTQNTADAADDKTFLVFGDATQPRVAALWGMHDDGDIDLKTDVLQAAHHGMYGGHLATYQVINPSISFIPVSETVLKNHESNLYGTDYNAYLRNNSTVYYQDYTTVINMATLAVSTWG